MLELAEIRQLLRLVKCDQIVHPTKRHDIRDCVVLAHDPATILEPHIERAEQAFGERHVAIPWSLVANLAI